MSPMRRVLVCGAGAVGSVYAAKLFDLAPASVALVASGERLERYRREGLVVNRRRYDFELLGPEGSGEPADLVLVAVKQHHLGAAVAELQAHVGPHTVLLSLLNGISSERVLAEAFGAEKVLHAYAVGTDFVREGNATRYTQLGQVVLGAAPGGPGAARVDEVHRLFDEAGIPHRVSDAIVRELWWKFMLNVGVNQVSAVLRAPYGAFALPEVGALTRAAMREVVALSAHEGVGLTEADVDRCFPIFATLAPGGKTSMLQDVEAGRKTEVDIFAGEVVALGKKHQVPTPVNEVLGRLIRALEALAGGASSSRGRG